MIFKKGEKHLKEPESIKTHLLNTVNLKFKYVDCFAYNKSITVGLIH